MAGYDSAPGPRGRDPGRGMGSDDYQELDRSLSAVGSGVEASEAHGCLCGALCAVPLFPAAEWAAELLPDDAGAAASTALLSLLADLREQTLGALSGDDMTFEPLLPADTAPLDERVRALAAWCTGFLFGLGRSGTPEKLPGDLAEIMQDFSEISRAALAAGEGGEEAERDFTELVEFVRASTQLAFEELAPHRARSAPAGGQSH